jgi:RNA polymerase sigma-70 factor (ECF subfamily)
MFDAHHDVVWRTLRRLGVPPAQVDDATQRVFLVAVRRLDEIRSDEESRFLYGVALRVASEMRRRDPARRYSGDDDALERIVDPAPRADERLIEKDARVALDEVLAGMPEDLRQVLVLVELEGLTVPVVAELLGVPTGTAASRVRRAREAFSEGARRFRARLERGAR